MVVAVICGLGILFCVQVGRRRRQGLKKAGGNARYQNISSAELQTQRMLATRPSEFDAALAANANAAEDVGVNRNTSVRSIMTLPAYNPKPYDTEQILGREGERAGIDTVIEYPETHEEGEARRDEEMETLYQVRVARRLEVQGRNERRRLRNAAREAGDHATLRRLREQEQERERIRVEGNASNRIEQLRAEAERAKARPRAVSSVAYGDLGVARHDGTRLRISSDDGRARAGSMESERQGLLGDTASMAESSRGPSHLRNTSGGSIASVETDHSPEAHLTNSDSSSRPITPLRIMTSPAEADLGLERIDLGENRALSAQISGPPTPPPPGYENVELGSPPIYSSPINTRPNSQRFSFPDEDTAYHGASQEDISMPTITTTMEIPPTSHRSTPISSRGVGGVPQLPSLRLGNLPSIVVDDASARIWTQNEGS